MERGPEPFLPDHPPEEDPFYKLPILEVVGSRYFAAKLGKIDH